MKDREKTVCRDCAHWDAFDHEGDLHPDDRGGMCRRYPPTRMFGLGKNGEDPYVQMCEWVSYSQVATTALDWCGEHKPKAPA